MKGILGFLHIGAPPFTYRHRGMGNGKEKEKEDEEPLR